MEGINFDHITNLNCSLKESGDDDEKIYIYSDDNDKNVPKNQTKNSFNDVFKKMVKNLNILSLNATNIIKEKKFSCKKLFNNFQSIKANKIDENIKKGKFGSIKDKSQFSKKFDNNNIINNNNNTFKNDIFKERNNNNSNNNSNLLNLSKSNSNSMSNIYSLIDINSISSLNFSKSSSNSEKNGNFIENKRKRQNSHNESKEDPKKVFDDILTISNNISNIQHNLTEIKGKLNELLNDNNNKEISIFCKGKEIASIYFNENIIQRIHIIKDNKYYTEENEIYNKLKNIRTYFNRICNKLKRVNGM